MKFTSKENLELFAAKFKAWVSSRKITASDMDSGSATSGQVPTADGQGGVTYATPSSGTTVVANPTLAGTEAELEGLQIDTTKYGMTKVKVYHVGSNRQLPTGVTGSTLKSLILSGTAVFIVNTSTGYVYTLQKSGDYLFGAAMMPDDDAVQTYQCGIGTTTSDTQFNFHTRPVLSKVAANVSLLSTDTLVLNTIQIGSSRYKNQPPSVQYLTTAPTADNTDGGIIKVYLPKSAEASTTKYAGYEYNFYEVVS